MIMTETARTGSKVPPRESTLDREFRIMLAQEIHQLVELGHAAGISGSVTHDQERRSGPVLADFVFFLDANRISHVHSFS